MTGHLGELVERQLSPQRPQNKEHFSGPLINRESFPLRSTGLVREAQPHLGAKVRSDRLRTTLVATSLNIPQQLKLGRG